MVCSAAQLEVSQASESPFAQSKYAFVAPWQAAAAVSSLAQVSLLQSSTVLVRSQASAFTQKVSQAVLASEGCPVPPVPPFAEEAGSSPQAVTPEEAKATAASDTIQRYWRFIESSPV